MAIIGCGGIGNHVSVTLATAGVGKIFLVDADIVELTNLTRQVLFTESNVGDLKVQVAKSAIIARNSEIQVEAIELDVQKYEDLLKVPACDLFVLSADSFNIVNLVNRFCVEKKQNYINVGYINDIAVIGPFYIPGKSACFECLDGVPREVSEDQELAGVISSINSNSSPATLSAINNLSASFASLECIKYLGGFSVPLSVNRRVGFHSMRLEIQTQEIQRQPTCICREV